MGVYCWIGEAFGYVQNGYAEGYFPPGQWILLLALRRIRWISFPTEITNASAACTQ